MQIKFVELGGRERESSLFDAEHLGIPRRGDLVDWGMGSPQRGWATDALADGRYSVENVVWKLGSIPTVFVYVTKLT